MKFSTENKEPRAVYFDGVLIVRDLQVACQQ